MVAAYFKLWLWKVRMSGNFSADLFYDMFREAEINANAFEEWRDYREAVTRYIIEASRPGSSVTIFGAGRCNDIDLAELKEHFGAIRLVDFDKKAMWAAVEKYGISAGTELVEHDLVGIKREWYIRFIELFHNEFMHLKTRQDCRMLSGELIELMRSAYGSIHECGEAMCGKNENMHESSEEKCGENEGMHECGEAMCGKNENMHESSEDMREENENTHESCEATHGKHAELQRTDYSVILGVHSQLNNSFSGIWNYVLAAVRGLDEISGELADGIKEIMIDIENEQRRHTGDIVRRMNDLLLATTQDSVFMGYELYVTDNPQSPVEGAYQCSQDFESREKMGKIRTESYIRTDWPLARDRRLVYNTVVGKFSKL